MVCFRAIVWLQNRREATVERTRTTSSVRRDDPGEFRVGRLKHERVKVPRGESLMEWAENVMQIHADRKSVLEVTSCKVKLFGFLWERMHGNQGSYLHCVNHGRQEDFLSLCRAFLPGRASQNASPLPLLIINICAMTYFLTTLD